jgi:hypothetical protein
MSDKQVIEELAAEESMFVQTAHGITSDGTTLTLKGSPLHLGVRQTSRFCGIAW